VLNIEKARRALEETARREGVTYDTLIKHIEYSISEAILSCQKSNNVSALAVWKEIPCVGDVPTPLELVAFLSERIQGRVVPLSMDNDKNIS